ncbi:hypothetical protein GGR57DRAFT_455644 [Xylariaceae sp. FL1272]|nr:hypothetical protein GGR57DRAFT_455644 [Xylariaceae sp. FL1272]
MALNISPLHLSSDRSSVRIGPSLDAVQGKGREADFFHGGRDVQRLVALQSSKGITYVPRLDPVGRYVISIVETEGNRVKTPKLNVLGGLVEDALSELIRAGADHLDGRLLADRNVVIASCWTGSDDADLVGCGVPERSLVLVVVHSAASERE